MEKKTERWSSVGCGGRGVAGRRQKGAVWGDGHALHLAVVVVIRTAKGSSTFKTLKVPGAYKCCFQVDNWVF